jgi:hypothetical protein
MERTLTEPEAFDHKPKPKTTIESTSQLEPGNDLPEVEMAKPEIRPALYTTKINDIEISCDTAEEVRALVESQPTKTRVEAMDLSDEDEAGKTDRRTWGTGSIFEQDGRWLIRWRENGERHSASFAIHEEAEAALKEILVRIDRAKSAKIAERVATADLAPIENRLKRADDADGIDLPELPESVRDLREVCWRLDEIEYEIGLLLHERKKIVEKLQRKEGEGK